jgi:hypothetical protein
MEPRIAFDQTWGGGSPATLRVLFYMLIIKIKKIQ